MAELTNANFRGIRITPEGKSQSYHYYLCVIDQPQGSSFDPSQVSIIEPQVGDTELKFSYNGTLQNPDTVNDLVWTFALPIYTNQKIATDTDNLTVTITDNSPDNNFAKGVPNKGKPPVVQPVDGQHDLTANFVGFKCQTGVSSPLYILGIIVNTNFYLSDGKTLSNGGYSNSFIVNVNTEIGTLSASLNPLQGKGPVAAFGIVSTMGNWQGYTPITIKAGDQSKSTPIGIPDFSHSF